MVIFGFHHEPSQPQHPSATVLKHWSGSGIPHPQWVSGVGSDPQSLSFRPHAQPQLTSSTDKPVRVRGIGSSASHRHPGASLLTTSPSRLCTASLALSQLTWLTTHALSPMHCGLAHAHPHTFGFSLGTSMAPGFLSGFNSQQNLRLNF